MLAAVAREVNTEQEETTDAQAAADWDTPEPSAAKPPSPLPGYRIIEITIADGSPAAGMKLADITWPPGYLPVSVLHDRSLRAPDPQAVLGAGDRVNLLTPRLLSTARRTAATGPCQGRGISLRLTPFSGGWPIPRARPGSAGTPPGW